MAKAKQFRKSAIEQALNIFGNKEEKKDSNEMTLLKSELQRISEERDKYKSLYEKSEREISNLTDEMEEIHLKHTAELKAVRDNLDVNLLFNHNFYSSESISLT